MLDAKLVRTEPEKVRQALIDRNEDTAILDEFLDVDEKLRKMLFEVEQLKAERNAVSEQIAQMKKSKQDASSEIERMREVSRRIKQMDSEVAAIDQTSSALMMNIPNIPHSSVPVGKDETDNQVVRYWGEKRVFDFEPVPHWELATTLDIIDFERGSKIAGSGFILYKGLGARLERSLFNWMLDVHTSEHGYTEIFPPFLVNRRSMIGTGQLPKFEEDMYHTDKDDDLFLDPTAEVPVTNIYMDEILDADRLPVYHTAYTACFRREAGSAGKDTRGLLRVHQFDKVEMVKFTTPETSYDEHEKLLANAEVILRRLNIPYRIVLLCTGDQSFSAAKCYDIEIHAPGIDKWLEVSSCSNFEDFQARRANIRYRPEPKAKPEFVHTLNASGVALPRLVVCILENYQQRDGTIVVPEALRPYMGVDKIG
ncbi:MAG: serine--tRNA ligase [Armatimonadetes bacterium RBG_16_58_9]|nr:MAG: serine--tRNA ligase [Armatimonadetes bacterium RBG_16_58_9]